MLKSLKVLSQELIAAEFMVVLELNTGQGMCSKHRKRHQVKVAGVKSCGGCRISVGAECLFPGKAGNMNRSTNQHAASWIYQIIAIIR